MDHLAGALFVKKWDADDAESADQGRRFPADCTDLNPQIFSHPPFLPRNQNKD
jgi:hypothetical protein